MILPPKPYAVAHSGGGGCAHCVSLRSLPAQIADAFGMAPLDRATACLKRGKREHRQRPSVHLGEDRGIRTDGELEIKVATDHGGFAA